MHFQIPLLTSFRLALYANINYSNRTLQLDDKVTLKEVLRHMLTIDKQTYIIQGGEAWDANFQKEQ